MKYKLISVDLDGTLLNSNKKVSKLNKEVLNEFKNLGYIIVCNTGRNYCSTKDVCEYSLFDYVILNNGSYLYDVNKNNGEYLATIDKNLFQSIFDDLKEYIDSISYVSVNKYFVYNNKNNYIPKFVKDINSVNDIDEDISRITTIIKNDVDIFKLQKFISNKYKNLYCYIMKDSFDKNKWIEINPKNIDKYMGLKILGDKLNINTNEMICFGDGLNDVEMIKNVGVGIAVANALECVKNNAKYITLSNDEDGVAKFLLKMK